MYKSHILRKSVRIFPVVTDLQLRTKLLGVTFRSKVLYTRTVLYPAGERRKTPVEWGDYYLLFFIVGRREDMDVGLVVRRSQAVDAGASAVVVIMIMPKTSPIKNRAK